MFISGILGMILWVATRRSFKGYKYSYRLLIRILIQLCVVGLISILSTTMVFPPRYPGEESTFIPLSIPLLLDWGISGFAIWPPYIYYTISIFSIDIITGGSFQTSSSEFGWEIFLNSMPLFFLLNIVFTGGIILLSELWEFFKTRNNKWVKITEEKTHIDQK